MSQDMVGVSVGMGVGLGVGLGVGVGVRVGAGVSVGVGVGVAVGHHPSGQQANPDTSKMPRSNITAILVIFIVPASLQIRMAGLNSG